MKLYVKFLKQYVFCKNNLFKIIFAFIILSLGSLISLILPLLSKIIVESIITFYDIYILNRVCAVAIIVIFISAGLGILQNYIIHHFVQTIALNIRCNFFEHIQNISWDFYDRFKVGEIQYRFFNDIGVLSETAAMLPINLIINLLFVFVSNIIMFFLNWKIACFIDGILIIYCILYYFWQKRIEYFAWLVQKGAEEAHGITQEQISRLKLAQLNSALEFERSITKNILKSLADQIVLRNVYLGKSGILIGAISGFWSIGILWIGGYSIIAHNLTLGDLIAFLSLTTLMVPVATGFVTIIIQFPSIRVSLTRYYEIMDQISSVSDELDAKPMDAIIGRINFNNLTFKYTGSPYNLFSELNFSILAGKLAVIVGPSGSGKSTILKLIGRFYSPMSGSVKIDGIDLRKVTLDSLREQIRYLDGKNVVLPMTIFENICYGVKNKSLEEVIEASQMACIHEHIQSLPNGYFTRIGAHGIELSDGEKQRINIARCFLVKPKIWLLDEATVHLDECIENQILQNIIRANYGKNTVIVVSHNQKIVKYADIVIRLPDATNSSISGG